MSPAVHLVSGLSSRVEPLKQIGRCHKISWNKHHIYLNNMSHNQQITNNIWKKIRSECRLTSHQAHSGDIFAKYVFQYVYRRGWETLFSRIEHQPGWVTCILYPVCILCIAIYIIGEVWWLKREENICRLYPVICIYMWYISCDMYMYMRYFWEVWWLKRTSAGASDCNLTDWIRCRILVSATTGARVRRFNSRPSIMSALFILFETRF